MNGYRIIAKGKEADIFIYEDVGDGFFGGFSAKQFSDDLKKIGAVDILNVHINSYGGDVFEGLAVYRQLADYKARKIVQIDGIGASIASVIAMSGNEIRMSAAGFMMIHDAWGAIAGNATEMRDMADKLEMVSGSIADVYTARTQQKREKIIDWMHAETWFDAKDAVANGFATSIVKNVQMAARFDPAKHRFRNMPSPLSEKSIEPQLPRLRIAQTAALERLKAKQLLRNSPGN